jgi:hypothetical protein
VCHMLTERVGRGTGYQGGLKLGQIHELQSESQELLPQRVPLLVAQDQGCVSYLQRQRCHGDTPNAQQLILKS